MSIISGKNRKFCSFVIKTEKLAVVSFETKGYDDIITVNGTHVKFPQWSTLSVKKLMDGVIVKMNN